MPTVKVTCNGASHEVEARSAHEAALYYIAAASGTPSLNLPRVELGDVLEVLKTA